jgi:hypothetical protein
VPTQWGGREYDLGAGLGAPARSDADADPMSGPTRAQQEPSGVRPG